MTGRRTGAQPRPAPALPRAGAGRCLPDSPIAWEHRPLTGAAAPGIVAIMSGLVSASVRSGTDRDPPADIVHPTPSTRSAAGPEPTS
jgi:hypothetical protein